MIVELDREKRKPRWGDRIIMPSPRDYVKRALCVA